jgi:hypothetical protein
MVHAAIRETAGELRSGNQVSGRELEEFPATARRGEINFPRNISPVSGVESQMKSLAVILVLALAAGGCTTKSTAQAKAQQAFLAGQNAALLQQQEAQFPSVTIVGPVQNPKVPWVAGLTLAQAIATANYLDSREPGQIIITRQGETAQLDPGILLNGVQVPLEQGDVIELKP